MAIIKAVNSRASLAIAINYITKDTKTDSALISGYNCRGTNALFEMKATKNIGIKQEADNTNISYKVSLPMRIYPYPRHTK